MKIFRNTALGFACRLVMLTVLLLVGGASVGMYAEVKPWAKYADGTLTFYYGEKSSLGTGEYELNSGYNTPGWYTDHKTDITKVVFNESFKDARPTTCAKWFNDMTNLKKIENLKNLNTSEVTNMFCMFYNCPKIQSLDLSNFNTENVTDMAKMFYWCNSLQSIDVSNFNTKNVTTMDNMFYYCRNIQSLDLSNFNTANVKDMAKMFYFCKYMQSLDLSNFNTANVTDMSSMFYNCTDLKAIYASGKFTTSNVTSSSDMFYNCTSLSGDITYDENTIDKTYAKIDGGYFRDKAYNRPWVKYADGTLTFQYGYKKTIDGSNGEYELNTGEKEPGWLGKNSSITKVVFDKSFKNARPTTGYKWFCDYWKLTEIENISCLNTSEMTDMGYMFTGCSSLLSLDLSNFNTAKVTDMYMMFYACRKLPSLDLSSFTTAKVTDMRSMFSYCYSLQSLDLSSFNTANVESMTNMFYKCSMLLSLDLSNFNTAKVTDMRKMFYTCSKLQSIIISKDFTTKSVKYTTEMFSGCYARLYTTMADYMARSDNKTIDGKVINPYFPINAKAEYGTLCSPVGGTLGKGSFYGFDKLYEVDADKTDDTKVVMKEVTEIEAGKPYIYRRNLTDSDPVASAIVFSIDETTATAPQNLGMLKGTFESMTAPGGSYILQTDGMFHRVSDSNATLKVGAYRAYLDLSTAGNEARTISMSFDNSETTGIREVNTSDTVDTPIYDLTGRRINTPQRGQIYIQNGKKRVANF